MLKQILIFLGKIFLIFSIFIGHIWINNVLPAPFDHINLIFSFLFIYLLIDEKGTIMWYILFFGLLSELFVSSGFGISLLSLFFCFLSARWLLTYFLTNRNFYIVTFASFVTIFIYRIYYLGLNSLVNFFFKKSFLYTPRTAMDYIYETLLTSLFIMLVYLVISRFITKLNPKYVKTI